jgi:tRNA(Ile)-lysidine synthase
MLIDKIKSTIQRYNLLQKHDSVLVGLSGGPDSVVLLYTLYALKKEYLLDIHIAHMDHKFRGEESKADAEFCEELAESLKLDISLGEADVPRIASEKGISAEEAARQERYDFFRRVILKKNIKKLAVGHNKDDQAETVLMRAIRGSGMTGLGGMSPVRNMRDFTVVRPLIEVSRKEIEQFIKENNLKFRHDSSNDKVIFTRNKVRHELMPRLEKDFNPNIKEVLVNMAENLREENDFLEKFAKRKFRSMSKKSAAGEIKIDIKKFKRQSGAIKKRIVRSALEELKGNLRRFTYQHWKEVEDLINGRPTNSVVDLPGGIEVLKNKNTLLMRMRG